MVELAREARMRVAVVGAGVSGLAAAHELARSGGGARVTVYEKEDCLGGHARTVAVDDDDAAAGTVQLDLGFMVFNRVRTSSAYVRQHAIHPSMPPAAILVLAS